MKVDAYCHCGISKFLPVQDVVEAMGTALVDRAVLVQHLGEFDNSYLAEVVRHAPEMFIAVGLIDHRLPGALATVESLARDGRFRGVRLPSEALVENREMCLSVAAHGLVPLIDAAGGIGEVRSVVRDLARSTSGPVVISHLGYPSVRDGRLERGIEILDLSDEPRVYVQLSGQGMVCEYPYIALDGLVREVLAAYGSGRTLWGSNYPVCGDADAYRRDLALVEVGAWGLSPEDVARIKGRTADAVWFA
jgi:L-fuconolactonase